MDKSKVKSIAKSVLFFVAMVVALVLIGIIGNWIAVLLTLCLMGISFCWGACWKAVIILNQAMRQFYDELLNSKEDLLKGKTVKYTVDRVKKILEVSLVEVR